MPKRVLFAFNNPNGQYEVIFDGYSQLYQLPIHVASEKSIHVIPTWYTVEETNYEGSINLWGRDENSIIKNLKNFNSKYVVIYQATNTKLETKWGKNFFLIDSLDFGKYNLSEQITEFNTSIPKFFLFKEKVKFIVLDFLVYLYNYIYLLKKK